jgi:PAS domain S-box-containing protein
MTSTAPALTIEQQLRELNDALLVSSVRQHEMAEQAQMAEMSVRESESRYRTLFDLVPVAVYTCDASGVIQKFNRRAAEVWGREPESGDTDERFCGSYKMFRPDGSFLPHAECPMAEVLRGEIPEMRDAEVLIERPDGSRITVIVNILPLVNQCGELTGAINCFVDITERKQAEQRQAMLTRELQHRTKNLLAVIQSIADRSLQDGRQIHDARASFVARLHALGHANDVLSESKWTGASLKEVIARASKAFSGRVSIEGEYVRLSPAATQGFALVIHELCTNASKYGAFSTTSGSVGIRWSIEHAGTEPTFVFRWQERGGPQVVPPKYTSFGTSLIQRAIGGVDTPQIEYAPEGLTCTVEAPLAKITGDPSRRFPNNCLSSAS